MASAKQSDTGILPAGHWGATDKTYGDHTVSDGEDSTTTSLASSIFDYRTLHGRTYHSDRGEATQYWWVLPVGGELCGVFTPKTKWEQGCK